MSHWETKGFSIEKSHPFGSFSIKEFKDFFNALLNFTEYWEILFMEKKYFCNKTVFLWAIDIVLKEKKKTSAVHTELTTLVFLLLRYKYTNRFYLRQCGSPIDHFPLQGKISKRRLCSTYTHFQESLFWPIHSNFCPDSADNSPQRLRNPVSLPFWVLSRLWKVYSYKKGFFCTDFGSRSEFMLVKKLIILS